MAKCHDLVHDVKDHRVLEHPVVVEFAQELYFGDPTLVELEVVQLKSKTGGFNNMVDDTNDEIGVVSVQCAEDDSKQMDIAILDLPWLGEDLVKAGNNL